MIDTLIECDRVVVDKRDALAERGALVDRDPVVAVGCEQRLPLLDHRIVEQFGFPIEEFGGLPLQQHTRFRNDGVCGHDCVNSA